MSSKTVIVLGILATFSILLVVSISMGYGSNQYLFQDGSTPLTSDWDAGSFKITLETLDTGQGANELYDMDQNVDSGSSVAFQQIIAEALVWIKRSNPNYYLRMLDEDTGDELRFYVSGGGTFICYVWDESEGVNRVAYRITPSEGYFTADNFALGVRTTEISGGIVNVTSSYAWIDTENDDPTDDLDTLAPLSGATIRDGALLILRSQASARDVVVKDNTGNIQLAGNVDFTLSHIRDRIMLMWDVGLGLWVELSRSDNA